MGRTQGNVLAAVMGSGGGLRWRAMVAERAREVVSSGGGRGRFDRRGGVECVVCVFDVALLFRRVDIDITLHPVLVTPSC